MRPAILTYVSFPRPGYPQRQSVFCNVLNIANGWLYVDVEIDKRKQIPWDFVWGLTYEDVVKEKESKRN